MILNKAGVNLKLRCRASIHWGFVKRLMTTNPVYALYMVLGIEVTK